MSNYYDMQEGKVNIAHALMNRGWKVYEYYPDESDSMTDYWSPAHWGGIATKNDFVLVVDRSVGAEPYEVKQYNPQGNLSATDRNKIAKLKQMTVERGCTESEAESAKKMIETISAKIDGNETYVVVDIIPGYMGNPGKCKWHIEKDGVIYDKGTGITKYSDIPEYGFNIMEEKYEEGYDTWGDGTKKVLTEKELKAVRDFKALILRFERVVNGMNTCGDGTSETAEQAKEQAQNEAMEKVIEKVTKRVIKPIQKEDNTINVNDILSLSYHSHYWIVAEIWNNSNGVPCATYELLGSEKRGYQRLNGTSAKRYYQTMAALQKEIEEGKTKVYTLQEVEETTEVEKWVRKNKYKQTKSETAQPESAETEAKISLEYDIREDVDTRDSSKIFVVKITKNLSRDEYIEVNKYMRSLGGYYSKFKKGFIFKVDPADKLKGKVTIETSTQAEETAKEPEPQEEFVPIVIGDYEISQSVVENNKVFVVKINKTLLRSEYEKINKRMQSLGASYNKFLHGFVFTENPVELLKTEMAA